MVQKSVTLESNEVDTIMDDSNEFSSIDDLEGSDDYDYGSIDDSGLDYGDMKRLVKVLILHSF